MLKKERYRRVISYFESTMPDVSSELAYTTPFQLLVAVVLSAQCTDKRVNMVTPALFSAFPTAEGDIQLYQKRELPQQQIQASAWTVKDAGVGIWR